MGLLEQLTMVRGSGAKRFPLSLQQQILAFVDERRRGGGQLLEVLEELGVTDKSYYRWKQKFRVLAPRPKSTFKAVVVREAKKPMTAELVPEIVIELSGKISVRGLSMQGLVEFARALQ